MTQTVKLNLPEIDFGDRTSQTVSSESDLEGLKQKLHELEEIRKRYELAIAGSEAGIWDWELRSGKVYFSDRVKELLGYRPDEFTDTVEEFWSRLHPDDHETVQRVIEQLVLKQRALAMDCRCRGKTGEYRWFHVRGKALWAETGEIIRVAGSMTDITERKYSEEEARLHREALARVNRASIMGQLTGSIAHELNQPLTGILGNAQAAELMINQDQVNEGELAGVIGEIVSDTKRAAGVIHNVRELFREQTEDFLPVDLNGVVTDTTRLFENEFAMQHVFCAKACTQTMPPVEGNKIQLQQVLVNLILNANEAMRDPACNDRRLRIGTEYDANEVKVWVEDSGPGIDADKLDRIFEPLSTWKPDGTGLGLAISNTIIMAHGGHMWAENMTEGGARAGFTLPVLKENHFR